MTSARLCPVTIIAKSYSVNVAEMCAHVNSDRILLPEIDTDLSTAHREDHGEYEGSFHVAPGVLSLFRMQVDKCWLEPTACFASLTKS